MNQDTSREKSLLFLLSTVARSLEVAPEYKAKIRQSIATLQIKDSGDRWEISTEVANQVRNKIVIAKDRFIFYPVKSKARYETNPAILNKNSAQEVLLSLLAEFGVRVPGKTIQPVQKRISDFLSLNLFWVMLISISAVYQITILSFCLIVAHLFMSTVTHFISPVRRWLLIAGVAIPALGFFVYNDLNSKNLLPVISQIILLFTFDILIRIEALQKSRMLLSVSRIVALSSILLITVRQTEARLSLTLVGVIVIIGYALLRQEISSSLRNFLVLGYLILFATIIVASVITNPFRALLIPYLVYVALYETLFGDNRNPSKIAFGAPCLAI